MMQLKSHLFVMSKGETFFDDVLGDIRHATIVHLGNHLGWTSYNKQSTDDYLERTALALKERGCNMVLIRGRYDNPKVWQKHQHFAYEGVIMFVDGIRKIGNCTFLGGGIPMLPGFRKNTELDQDDIDCIAFLQAHSVINTSKNPDRGGSMYVFSSIPPIHLEHEDFWLEYFAMQIRSSDTKLVKSLLTEITQMWINYELIRRTQTDKVADWYYNEFDKVRRQVYNETTFSDLGHDNIVQVY